MLSSKLLSSLGAQEKLHIDDVFSTYLYSGNGATIAINNGIDLAGKGGMVWTKCRNTSYDNLLIDTERGATKIVRSNAATAQETVASSLTAFGNSGYTLDTYNDVNASGQSYVSWTFRKAPKFFDIVTYTGNGVSGRTITHSLGAVPGMIFTKGLSIGRPWKVWHRSLATNNYLALHETASSVSNANVFTSTAPTSTKFSVGNEEAINENGTTYVAYLFAHDTTAGGLIQCGSFTTDVSGNAFVSHGWNYGVQHVQIKASDAVGNWEMFDTTRTPSWSSSDARLIANLSNVEAAVARLSFINDTTLGFAGLSASKTYVYVFVSAPT